MDPKLNLDKDFKFRDCVDHFNKTFFDWGPQSNVIRGQMLVETHSEPPKLYPGMMYEPDHWQLCQICDRQGALIRGWVAEIKEGSQRGEAAWHSLKCASENWLGAQQYIEDQHPDLAAIPKLPSVADKTRVMWEHHQKT
jgi:FAD binding domain of DNA photolyase